MGMRPVHGMTGTSEHNAWRSMKSRCYDPNKNNYKYYGGRGIKVCAAWRDNFQKFYQDMGPKPSPTHTLERIDNDKDYEPGNCAWVPWKEQSRNKRSNRLETLDGRTQTLVAWAEEYGMHKNTLHYRLGLGWSLQEALTRRIKGHP